MVTTYYADSEKLGAIYLSYDTAKIIGRDNEENTKFLKGCLKRYENGDGDAGIKLFDGSHNRIDVAKYVKRGYRFEKELLVIDKMYDMTLVFTGGASVDRVASIEREQSELEDICECSFEELYQKALDIATKAHSGQTDRGGHPYIGHPLHVAAHVDGKAEKIIALLHDVVEDTDVTIKDLEQVFPKLITDAVNKLTHRKDKNYLEYIIALKENEYARRVKIADMKHNMDISRIPEPTDRDKERVRTYAKYLAILEEDFDSE